MVHPRWWRHLVLVYSAPPTVHLYYSELEVHVWVCFFPRATLHHGFMLSILFVLLSTVAITIHLVVSNGVT